VGAAPFSGVPHLFQNLGDGTLAHSGTLAIRQAVAANANITYKILYNSAVAMTGGQAVDGGLPIPDLTRLLEAEGVRRTIVVSADPGRFPRQARWAQNVEIWGRERLDEAQRILRETPGVTALIYDQECAANLRRKRNRGQAPDPPRRIFINEAVCEGCGDCGHKSNCLSVVPVETEFGRKTQIHQSSCNRDYSCLEGDCPSFITVELDPDHKSVVSPDPTLGRLLSGPMPPEPRRRVSLPCHIYMMGIGGTGVVTANQILGTAGLLDGCFVYGLDQTGLSQKGGPVVSSLKILAQPQEVAHKVGEGSADLYLVFDLLTGSTDAHLSRAWPERTFAVVSTSQVPTGAMVRSPDLAFPPAEQLSRRIEARTRPGEQLYLDATGLAEALFGSHMQANLLLVGAAYQAGLLPLRAASIEQAIRLNGVAVEKNLEAFRAGRRLVAAQAEMTGQPDSTNGRVPALHPAGAMAYPAARPPLSSEAQALIDQVGAEGELRRLLEIRVPELIAYQDLAYARHYVAFVRQVLDAERRTMGDQTRLSEAVARYLFKLMAYKDEYEVARLHLLPEVDAALARQFGGGQKLPARIRYQLHPPLLRALGLRHKIGVGRWFRPIFRLLVWLRRLRGTRLDIFGYTHVRRVERALIGEYRTAVEQALAHLQPETYDLAVRLAELPDLVRGYEAIKLRNVDRYRSELRRLLAELESAAARQAQTASGPAPKA
ncbi:hypothetical protein RY27_19120, partial [Litorilinea aerophila]